MTLLSRARRRPSSSRSSTRNSQPSSRPSSRPSSSPSSSPRSLDPTESRPDTVSVVVCAHTTDRWDDIAAGQAALAAQTFPALERILVIDHNPELLARASEAFPGVRVLENAGRGGASGARNTGIGAATGDVVAFLDDDARPEPDWLEQLIGGYDDPAVMAVGGVARPVWPDRRPDHMPPELDWLVGCTYLGQPTERADVRNLWGCNMSVRRRVFDEIGGFHEDVGRIGLIPLGTEETELCIRIAQRKPGSRIVFEPAAVVHHRVTVARTEFAYLRSRSQAEGVSKAAMARLVGAQDATSEESRYVRTVLTAGLRRELGKALRGDRAGWRGARGIITCLGTTAYWYARGRLGHRAEVDAVALERRGRAA
nr:glycosyltransferase [Nocardioides sp.]